MGKGIADLSQHVHRRWQERRPDPVPLPAPEELERGAADAGLTAVHQVCSTLDYDLDEWIAHGAPGEAARKEILALMESCLAEDRIGLQVRREGGRLRFSHRVAAFVLARA